jgi:hypothetical protein
MWMHENGKSRKDECEIKKGRWVSLKKAKKKERGA